MSDLYILWASWQSQGHLPLMGGFEEAWQKDSWVYAFLHLLMFNSLKNKIVLPEFMLLLILIWQGILQAREDDNSHPHVVSL